MAFDVGGGAKGRVSPSMNVTPLVDVVLVLLIIFMVVTPLLTKRMWMHIPPKDDQETPPPPPPPGALPPVVLTLGADGQTRVNGEVIPREQLAARVQGMMNARADKVVFFDAANRTPYGEALAVMDLLKGGGVNDLAVLAENLADPQPAESVPVPQ
jgi:biopolymer transport protein ExbD